MKTREHSCDQHTIHENLPLSILFEKYLQNQVLIFQFAIELLLNSKSVIQKDKQFTMGAENTDERTQLGKTLDQITIGFTFEKPVLALMILFSFSKLGKNSVMDVENACIVWTKVWETTYREERVVVLWKMHEYLQSCKSQKMHLCCEKCEKISYELHPNISHVKFVECVALASVSVCLYCLISFWKTNFDCVLFLWIC